MLALSRSSTALRWRLSLRCSALPLGSTTMSSEPSTATWPQFLRTQTALFHQSKAKASPDPNKPASVLSGLEGELFGMGMWSLGLGAVGAALAGIFLANTDLCLQKTANASLEHLEDTDLRSTIDNDKVVKAKSLWETNGAVVMAVRRPG
uniref:Peroxiredoxin-like 2 activated in M-CSF stimulated monocytes n=3 Tax=Dicentrarchus labrax TaxID=13489 RepID=A0A8C4D9F5_DICLA